MVTVEYILVNVINLPMFKGELIVLQIVPVAKSKRGTRNKPQSPSNSPPRTEANKKRATR